MDYWYGTGNPACNKHHLVLVPHEAMYNRTMNDTNTTDGGYVGSGMYTNGLTSARNIIASSFPNMLLTHKEYLVNAVTEDGYPSAATWVDSTIELMNEIMLYASDLGLVGIWLRDISSEKYFCSLTVGSASSNSATTERGVAPVFGIVGD